MKTIAGSKEERGGDWSPGVQKSLQETYECNMAHEGRARKMSRDHLMKLRNAVMCNNWSEVIDHRSKFFDTLHSFLKKKM